MYKNYNMTQLTLPIETSVKIPQNDISRYVNEIVETIPDSECDDCSACSLRQQCMKPNSKSNKKIMKNYNWEYFKAQINLELSEPETKKIYSQRKIDVEPVFGFMKAILGFTRMSVRGINKVKRELGFVLMALNIRKIAAQRAVHYKIHIKKADFYQINNRNQLFYIA